MKTFVRKWVLFVVLFGVCGFCFSCNGYRWGQGEALNAYSSITIPYVEGDWDGDLTAALVQQVSQSGLFRYNDSGASLALRVKILDYEDENIGFRYDRTKHGKFTSSVIPEETRTTVFVEVMLEEVCSGRAILGPVRLSASVVFDHDYYTSRNGVNVFSLGQLTDIDDARDTAQRPLNRNLARKIVDYLAANF